MWRAANDNSYVELRGQGGRPYQLAGGGGYAMVALLVGMSVMAILMGAALPVWNKQAQREREEEYLFRAHEYARGILKFQRKAGPGTLPPSLDVLVEQRFVRRKYKDPITRQDFQPVYQTAGPIGQPGGGAVGAGSTPGMVGAGSQQAGSGLTSTSTQQTGGTSTTSQTAAMPGAPVIGVVSKSKATSIKVYNGRTRYDQWAVTWQDVKPGKGLPPDILQAINQAGAQQGQGGQPGGGFGGQGGGPGNPFGQPATGNPFGQPGTGNPFGQPGTGNPFGQAPGQPVANPFGSGSTFSPAYPPPPGQTGASPFGVPPKKQN